MKLMGCWIALEDATLENGCLWFIPGSHKGKKHAQIQRGKQGLDPLKNHENIGFLSNTGPDPLKNHKATKPAFNVGPLSARQRNALNGISLMGQ